MANNDPNLRVRISADINDIKQGLAMIRSDFGKFRQEAAKSIDLKGITDSFSNLRNVVGGLFAGVTVGTVFKAIISETRDAADEVAQLQAVLASTGQQAGYTAKQLLEMASSLSASTTHSSGEIVKAQTRLLSYTGIVGKQFPQALQMAIDQSARLGENIEQSAETIGKALDKPSQGVAALTKQGFKFSEQQKQQMKVMEATGRTAEAQQIVLEAMAESYAGAAAAARNTFGGALTAVGNSLKELVDGSAGGSLSGVTQAINSVAKALGSPELRAAASEMVDAILGVVAGFARFIAQDGVRYLASLARAVELVVKNFDLLLAVIAGQLVGRAIPLLLTGGRAVIAWLVALRAGLFASTSAARGLQAALALAGGPVTLAITALTTAMYYLYQRTQDATEAAEAHKRALKDVAEISKTARDQAFELAKAKREEAIQTLNAAKAHLQAAQYEAKATGFAVGGGGPLGGARASLGENDPRVTRAKAQADAAEAMLAEWDEAMFNILTTGIDQMLKPVADGADAVGAALTKSNALLIDGVRRALSELDRMYQENSVSIADYFAQRTALQQKSIDLEIDQARAERASTTDAAGRRRIEEQIIKLQRDRAEVATVAATEQKKAELDLAKSLDSVKGSLLELDGKAGQAQRAELEAQYAGLLRRLRAEGDATGQALVNSLIDRLVAKAKSDELRDAMGRVTAQLQGRETNISAQVSGGMMGYGEGEAQLAAARAEALADLQALRIAAVEAMAAYAKGSPEHAAAVAGLREIDTEIGQVLQSQQVWAQKIQDNAAGAFGDFLADLSTKTKGFKEAFADMVKSFIANVARMAAQEAALRGISALFGNWGTAPAGNTGATVAAGKRHTGGRIGTGGAKVRLPVSSLLAGQAPRYHGGGHIGLKNDERLTVLQTGERVLSRNQTAAYDASMRAGTGAGAGGYGDVSVYINGVQTDSSAVQVAGEGGGNLDVTVMLKDLMRGQIRGGAFDRDLRDRYGLNYRGNRGG
jgi:hypothetical protein